MITETDRDLIRAELQTDPEGMGYAAAITSQDWDRVASLLMTGSPGSTRPRASVSRGAFSLGIAMSAFRIAELTDNQQRKWDRVLSLVLANETIDLSSPQVLGMLSVGVSEGVITQSEVDALTREPCTRLQELTGYSGVITADDIADLIGSVSNGASGPGNAIPSV